MTERPDPGWRIADAVLAFGVGLIVAAAAQLAVGADPSTTALFGLVVPAQTLPTAAVILVLAARSETRRTTLGLTAQGSDLAGLAVGVGLQVAIALALAIVVTMLNIDPPQQEIVVSADEAFSLLDRALVVIGGGLLAPLAEELVFRGALLRALQWMRGDKTAVFGSAGAFAAVHLLDPNAILAVPMLFVVGIVLARQAISTGRLARPFFTHAGFNLVSLAVLFLVP